MAYRSFGHGERASAYYYTAAAEKERLEEEEDEEERVNTSAITTTTIATAAADNQTSTVRPASITLLSCNRVAYIITEIRFLTHSTLYVLSTVEGQSHIMYFPWNSNTNYS
jgi:hypothetical protein